MEIGRHAKGLVDKAAVPRVVEKADASLGEFILGDEHILEAIVVVVDKDHTARAAPGECVQPRLFGHVGEEGLRGHRNGQQQTEEADAAPGEQATRCGCDIHDRSFLRMYR